MKNILTILLSCLCLMGVLTSSAQEAKKEKKEKKSKSKKEVRMKQFVAIETSMGRIVVGLYENTPKHRDNFMKNVNDGFYKDLLFHRVIKEFMIQGGDPASAKATPQQQLGMGSRNNPPQRVPYEFLPQNIHKKGTLAAARDNNPEKASSDCQFYIVQGKKFTEQDVEGLGQRSGMNYTEEQKQIYATLGGTPHLDNNYTTFGEVVEGLDIVDKIAATDVNKALGDRPKTDVKFTITAIKKAKKEWKSIK